ncbi:MAG: hypothetical protein WCH83_15330 [Alphaproteobacteria bacterium]|jgi:hypothetical protein
MIGSIALSFAAQSAIGLSQGLAATMTKMAAKSDEAVAGLLEQSLADTKKIAALPRPGTGNVVDIQA